MGDWKNCWVINVKNPLDAMFEDDPEWLYKDDCVYEQMTLEEFLKEGNQ